MADLDPARVEVQVSFDDPDAELLRSVQPVEVVPRTVGDDERADARRRLADGRCDDR